MFNIYTMFQVYFYIYTVGFAQNQIAIGWYLGFKQRTIIQ